MPRGETLGFYAVEVAGLLLLFHESVYFIKMLRKHALHLNLIVASARIHIVELLFTAFAVVDTLAM